MTRRAGSGTGDLAVNTITAPMETNLEKEITKVMKVKMQKSSLV